MTEMTESGEHTGRLLGSLREEGGRGTVRVEDVYATTIDDLWSAITDPARVARWIATVEGDLRIGGEFRASFTSGWTGTARVDVCDAPHRLVISSWDEESEATAMEAVLSVEGDGTRLVVEERGLPLNEYAGHGSGWQAHLEDLASYLADRPTSDWSERWRELTPAYERMRVTSA